MIGFTTHLPLAYRALAEMNVEHLRELQRFAEVGRVSAGLIHDLSSPLTAAILHLEQTDPRRESGVQHARRSMRVLERYIEAARRQLSQQDSVTVFCVKQEVWQIKSILQPIGRRRGVHLRFDVFAGDCRLLGDPVKFQRIIINLVTNSMDAYSGFSTRKPMVKTSLKIDGNDLLISVHDRGKGISDKQLTQLFKPFYTTKKLSANGGNGIGLSTTRQYVEETFGGAIAASSSKKKGTELRITMPFYSYADA